MKIKVIDKDYNEVLALPRPQHELPSARPAWAGWLLKTVSAGELKKVHFSADRSGFDGITPNQPCLVLMNHSSFIDLKIAATVLYPRSFHIVCTSDGFVGKERLMRTIGCIPTKKFITDTGLVRDMVHTVKNLHSSILMYPEASYSFDGTATPLPKSLGKCIRLLGIPVIMIRTHGAFLRDPLYNNLQLRNVDVTAETRCLLTKEQVKTMKPDAINAVLEEAFSLDYFKEQKELGIRVGEPFRADGLHRVLYRCPACHTEGRTIGQGTKLTCQACGKVYELTEAGEMRALSGVTEYPHIPDWYRYERECVRKELADGTYRMELPVTICMMVDMKAIYRVGIGTLVHSPEGFHLTGCDGRLDYRHAPSQSYSLYADYYWYEIGDIICIGNQDVLYYCFPTGSGQIVAKARLAAEELFRMKTGMG